MIAITIDVSEVTPVLRLFGENLSDLSEPFKKLGELALEDARSTILAQGGLFGAGWAEMSPLTHVVAAALYGRGRDPRTLLYDTRGLLESLTPEAEANIFEIEPLEAAFGSRYTSSRTGYGIAKGQQEGTSRTFHVLQGSGFSETGTPPRDFLSWHPERFDEYDGIFTEHVAKGIGV